MHPLTYCEEPIEPEVVADDAAMGGDETIVGVPVPHKSGHLLHDAQATVGEGTQGALTLAKRLSPKIVRRLVALSLTSPNHAASRAACRDLLQIAGLLTETTRVDVAISFRGVFAQMTAEELDGFLTKKVFPERLRAEATKLLEASG